MPPLFQTVVAVSKFVCSDCVAFLFIHKYVAYTCISSRIIYRETNALLQILNICDVNVIKSIETKETV